MKHALLLLLHACAGGSDGTTTPPSTTLVTQNGVRDLEEFRSIVRDGSVPAPEVLDEMGFFAEHRFDLPAPTCGKTICIAPTLAVAPTISGDVSSLLFVGLSANADPAPEESPNQHVVLAFDRNAFAAVSDALYVALDQIAGALGEGDRFSAIVFGETVQTLATFAEEASAAQSALGTASDGSSFIDLYGALVASFAAIESANTLGFTGDHRIVLVSSGKNTGSISDRNALLSLVRAFRADDIITSVVRVDTATPLLADLAEAGRGNLYTNVESRNLGSVFDEELASLTRAIADNFELEVLPSLGYRIGHVWGADNASNFAMSAELSLDRLFVTVSEPSGGMSNRSYGGGASLFVELVPTMSAPTTRNEPAARVVASWQRTSDDMNESDERVVRNSLVPGEPPNDSYPVLSDGDDPKPFVAHTVFRALETALDFYDSGDCARALGALDSVRFEIESFLAGQNDPDLTRDLTLIADLRDVMNASCGYRQPISPNFVSIARFRR